MDAREGSSPLQAPVIDSVRVSVNGAEVEVPEGTSVAAAIALAGERGFRRSPVRGQLRAPVCGMGICFECRVTVDGAPHVRSCMMACRSGMEIRTDG